MSSGFNHIHLNISQSDYNDVFGAYMIISLDSIDKLNSFMSNNKPIYATINSNIETPPVTEIVSIFNKAYISSMGITNYAAYLNGYNYIISKFPTGEWGLIIN